ncbi:MAG: type II toxin-antitoxin system VapC family toxin [Burkholderiales bacterium]
MGIVVDTCVFVLAEKAGLLPDLEQFNDDMYISAITVSELMVGVHRANTTERRIKRAAFIDAILAEIPALDFTAQVAHIHAEICAALAELGCKIGPYDSQIAATALSHNYAVLTYNHNEFIRVPGLKVIQ